MGHVLTSALSVSGLPVTVQLKYLFCSASIKSCLKLQAVELFLPIRRRTGQKDLSAAHQRRTDFYLLEEFLTVETDSCGPIETWHVPHKTCA